MPLPASRLAVLLVPAALRAACCIPVLAALALLTPVRAGDEKAPESRPASRPAEGAASRPASRPAKAADLVPIPEPVAKALERFDALGEPKREAARVFCSLYAALLRRDLDSLLKHFHPDFLLHVGEGKLEHIDAKGLKEALKGLPERPETKLALETLLDLDTLRAYTRDECKEGAGASWKKDPKVLVPHMEKDDLVVLARTRTRTWSGGDGDDEEKIFDKEVFYVVRRDGARFKAYIGE